jgi:hypothetical protein
LASLSPFSGFFQNPTASKRAQDWAVRQSSPVGDPERLLQEWDAAYLGGEEHGGFRLAELAHAGQVGLLGPDGQEF